MELIIRPGNAPGLLVLAALALEMSACDAPLTFPFDVATDTYSATMRCDPDVASTSGAILLENEGDFVSSRLHYRYRGTPTLVSRESPDEAVFDVMPAPGAGVETLRFHVYGVPSALDAVLDRELNVVIDANVFVFSLSYFVAFSDDDGDPLFMVYTGGSSDLQLADCAAPWFCPRLHLQDDACSSEEENCGHVRHVAVRYDLAFGSFELTPGSELHYDDGIRSFRLVLHDAYRRGETTCTDLGSSWMSTVLVSEERPSP